MSSQAGPRPSGWEKDVVAEAKAELAEIPRKKEDKGKKKEAVPEGSKRST